MLDEAADGDTALAQRRLQALTDVPILPIEEAILEIAEEILRKAILPRSASVDALHIANARILPKVFDVLDRVGLARRIICTPQELLNDDAEIS